MTRPSATTIGCITADAEELRNNEAAELANIYLDLAIFWIRRNANRGYYRASIYLPFEVKKVVVCELEKLGYSVDFPEPCKCVINWKKVIL